MDFRGEGDGSSFQDIPTRPMRVKVLYTFDNDAKTTCLARFPDTQNIPVVAIDEQSQVGVIDLYQCIQAIISASPEVLSKLENGDFTVYNYDFTENDTPIVGQGRLSTLLVGNNPGQDKTMITGRVCKNIQALFSNGVKEILEVKFKLTPLSKPTQNEYAKTVDSLRSMSPATSAGFDPNAWNASAQQNRTQQQSTDYFAFDALAGGGDDGSALLDDMFGIGTGVVGTVSNVHHPGGVGMPETPTDSAFMFNPAFSTQSHSAPGSRAGSPVMHLGSSTFNEHLRHQSFSAQSSNAADLGRSASRASMRSETNTSRQPRQTSTLSQQHTIPYQPSEVFYNEDGQTRKRAKVTQADWRGKSSFGAKSSDLRVTAATASSMHMFRPIAKRPSAPGTDLEPPPRVPTPVPKRMKMPRQPSRQPHAGGRSMLRQASTFDSDIMSDTDRLPEADSSPEGSSPARSITAEFTPMDIPSSPPLVPGYNQPTPSSPGLPTLPRMADSGYMSGSGICSGTVMESLEDEENRSPNESDFHVAAQYTSRSQREETFVKIEGSRTDDDTTSVVGDRPTDLNVQLEHPGDMSLLPRKRNSNLQPGQHKTSQGSRPLHSTAPSHRFEREMTAISPDEERHTRMQPSLSRRSSLALPPKLAPRSSTQEQDFAAPKQRSRQPLQRSYTANESEAGSPAPSDTEGRPRGPVRSGSGKPRRQLIEQRLQEAIAKGETPVFCSHCGAIETPTWRKIFVKTCHGKPGPLDYSEGEGETIGIQSTETDPSTGEITKFLLRKSMKRTKNFQPGEGFQEKVLCNPCGLWFGKFRCMRPEDKWHRKAATRRTKSSRDDGLFTDGMEPPSEAFYDTLHTDQVVPEDAMEDSNSTDDTQAEPELAAFSLQPARCRPRASSMQQRPPRRLSVDGETTLAQQSAGTRRETQSSPVRSHGSQDSPINLDLTPARPTRRLLFPSPREIGEAKGLEGSLNRKSASSSGLGKSFPVKAVAPGTDSNINVFEALVPDKENLSPVLDGEDDFSHLFEGSPSIFKTPLPKTSSKLMSRSSRKSDDVLRTPTPGSRKRKALTPSQNAANSANINANDFMTSPRSPRYFLRSTPSRLERTPGGRSVSGGSQRFGAVDPSPFSRHLAQMLSDADGMGAPFTSPNRQYEFSDLPTFTTPGREVDWKGLDDILSSEFANYDDMNGDATGNM